VETATPVPNPNYTNPPPPSLPEAVVDYTKAVAETLTAADLAKIAAGWTLINGVLTPPKLDVPSYGPIGPVEFGTVGQVNLPGVNPGQFMAGVPAQYQTTSPVQSRFFYGQRPLQIGETFSPEQYRAVNAPAQPWGLQQLYTPINPLEYASQQTGIPPVYPVGLAPVAPGTRA
jgi:hypothetical protein